MGKNLSNGNWFVGKPRQSNSIEDGKYGIESIFNGKQEHQTQPKGVKSLKIGNATSSQAYCKGMTMFQVQQTDVLVWFDEKESNWDYK